MHKNLKLALDLSPYLRYLHYLHISCSYTKDMGNRKANGIGLETPSRQLGAV
jgi:hypothetical protein